MNTIENTTRHASLEEAEDALAGLRGIPGFIFGYVRLPTTEGGQHETVTIFNCASTASLERGQRRVHIPAE